MALDMVRLRARARGRVQMPFRCVRGMRPEFLGFCLQIHPDGEVVNLGANLVCLDGAVVLLYLEGPLCH